MCMGYVFFWWYSGTEAKKDGETLINQCFKPYHVPEIRWYKTGRVSGTAAAAGILCRDPDALRVDPDAAAGNCPGSGGRSAGGSGTR